MGRVSNEEFEAHLKSLKKIYLHKTSRSARNPAAAALRLMPARKKLCSLLHFPASDLRLQLTLLPPRLHPTKIVHTRESGAQSKTAVTNRGFDDMTGWGATLLPGDPGSAKRLGRFLFAVAAPFRTKGLRAEEPRVGRRLLRGLIPHIDRQPDPANLRTVVERAVHRHPAEQDRIAWLKVGRQQPRVP